MRTSNILIASLLALASPAGALTASAQSAGAYESGVSVTAAPPIVDTGSARYPSSRAGVDGRRVSVTAAPPFVDAGSEKYPSSATGAGGRENTVIAGRAIVSLSNGESMPESINSFPPGFTDPYFSCRADACGEESND